MEGLALANSISSVALGMSRILSESGFTGLRDFQDFTSVHFALFAITLNPPNLIRTTGCLSKTRVARVLKIPPILILTKTRNQARIAVSGSLLRFSPPVIPFSSPSFPRKRESIRWQTSPLRATKRRAQSADPFSDSLPPPFPFPLRHSRESGNPCVGEQARRAKPSAERSQRIPSPFMGLQG